jgi:hypothetical protein
MGRRLMEPARQLAEHLLGSAKISLKDKYL